MKSRDPFTRRRYLHFDEPPPRAVVQSIATDPKRVASWGFLPLLRVSLDSKKVRRRDDGGLEVRRKTRPICYASHKDAGIYAYYGQLLSELYESRLRGLPFEPCVTAFRPGLGRCNIDFAKDAFECVQSIGACVVLAFDVRGFFDNLVHRHLKAAWIELLGDTSLPEDHFAVYRSIAKFAYVERDAVFREFGISRHNPRAGHRRRICTPLEFRDRVRGKHLVQTNSNKYGIPQGTPISAVLSNVYMHAFDAAVFARTSALGGIYRRYCDDILCAVPREGATEIEQLIVRELERVGLEAQAEKTTRHVFARNGDQLRADQPLQYLGFVFDGERVMLRTAGIARYYSRMRAGVRRAVAAASKAGGGPTTGSSISTKQLYTRYTYLGRRNFVAYALRASRTIGDVAIKRQIRSHWRRLKVELAKQGQTRMPGNQRDTS